MYFKKQRQSQSQSQSQPELIKYKIYFENYIITEETKVVKI